MYQNKVLPYIQSFPADRLSWCGSFVPWRRALPKPNSLTTSLNLGVARVYNSAFGNVCLERYIVQQSNHSLFPLTHSPRPCHRIRAHRI